MLNYYLKMETKLTREIVFAGLSLLTAALSTLIKTNTYALSVSLTVLGIMLIVIVTKIVLINKRNVDLTAHPFWYRTKFYLKHRLPYVKIKDPLRKKLFIISMKAKYTVIRSLLEDFILAEQFDKHKAKDLINNIIIAYESEWRKKHIPQIFIDKFHEYHRPKSKAILDYVEFICVSEFYDSDKDRKVAVLDGMLHNFQWTMIDIVRANNAINGELTDKLKELNDQGLI